MVIDPVCGMPVAPATALASVDFEGARLYFCSGACHRRFVADPAAYASTSIRRLAESSADSTNTTVLGASRNLSAELPLRALVVGSLATLALLGIYFGVLTLVSGWSFTAQQFRDFWPYITALAVGFGIQVGLFVHLRYLAQARTSGKVVAATGATSGAAMVSCCSHYLVNLLPALGATGLVSFVAQYQIQLFWLGLAANLAGIAYIGRRLLLLTQEG